MSDDISPEDRAAVARFADDLRALADLTGRQRSWRRVRLMVDRGELSAAEVESVCSCPHPHCVAHGEMPPPVVDKAVSDRALRLGLIETLRRWVNDATATEAVDQGLLTLLGAHAAHGGDTETADEVLARVRAAAQSWDQAAGRSRNTEASSRLLAAGAELADAAEALARRSGSLSDDERDELNELREKVASLRAGVLKADRDELVQRITAVGSAEWRNGHWLAEREQRARAAGRADATAENARQLDEARRLVKTGFAMLHPEVPEWLIDLETTLAADRTTRPLTVADPEYWDRPGATPTVTPRPPSSSDDDAEENR